MKTIKNMRLKSVLVVLLGILFISCNNNDDSIYSDVVGVYKGTLTSDIAGKAINAETTTDAIAVVTMIGDQIEVRCYNDDFDTTIMLNIYEDGDMINTCLTGTDFETMYGHVMGQGTMNGNMQNTDSEWMQHLNNEHQDNDEHFGGFNMQNNSFNYTFKLVNGDFHFQGNKN